MKISIVRYENDLRINELFSSNSGIFRESRNNDKNEIWNVIDLFLSCFRFNRFHLLVDADYYCTRKRAN